MGKVQATQTPLAVLQKQFAIIDLAGEIRVVDLIQIDEILNGQSPGEPAFYKKADAILMMKRALELLPVASNSQAVINDFWISPATVVYQGTSFSPCPTSSSTLNFWVGPCRPSDIGNPQPIFDYLRTVICANDVPSFNYLIGYLSHMIQKPEEKPGVMLVLLGRQGTGKGMFFILLRAIWPRTTLQVTDVDQVVGRFNAALERNFVVCMDEALFAGDRKAQDRLKSIITEPHINIEQKYQPSRSIGSVHRFFAASNHDHFAHVETDDRRFVFLRVSDVHRQDAAYFTKLAAEIHDPATIGGFVHHLSTFDLSSFEVRRKPSSQEHQSQKLKSLQGFDRYWYEVLLAGNLNAGLGFPMNSDEWSGPKFVPTESLVRQYTSFDKNAQRRQTVQSAEVLSAVARLCPSSKGTRQSHQIAGVATKAQKRGTQLPDLATARAEFERLMGGLIQWI